MVRYRTFDFAVVALMHKYSLEIDDADRRKLCDFIEQERARLYVITPGTDTMPETASIVARPRSIRQLSHAAQIGLFFPGIGSAE